MKTYKEEQVVAIRRDLVSVTCDICGKTYKNEYSDGVMDDIMELQEFHYIRFSGGYGSVFGDTVDVECDVCQHCLFEFIGEHYRVEGEEEDG